MFQFQICVIAFAKNEWQLVEEKDLWITIKNVHKMFWEITIFYPLIRTRMCAFQGVRNVSLSENFEYILNAWSCLRITICRWLDWRIASSILQCIKKIKIKLLESTTYKYITYRIHHLHYPLRKIKISHG